MLGKAWRLESKVFFVKQFSCNVFIFVGVFLLGGAGLLPHKLLAQSNSQLEQSSYDAPERPKLVLSVVVDQFRYDYLLSREKQFSAGLRLLLTDGAVFTQANYHAVPTVTATGHSTILSGAVPANSGIAGNSWYSRAEDQLVESITDNSVRALGPGEPASPKRLLVTTVGDELKEVMPAKVFGVSLKNRSAILPAGRRADGAFWLEGGQFVSSSWYFKEMPAWVLTFNAQDTVMDYAGTNWLEQTLPLEREELINTIVATPFADQMTLDFAISLIQEEQLGSDEHTDLLAVSFSSMDYLGHRVGINSPYMDSMILSIDDKIGKLIDAAEEQAGKGNVLVVFTADHGVAPLPERMQELKLSAGRYDSRREQQAVQNVLVDNFGEGEYILAVTASGYYLNFSANKAISEADPGKVFAIASATLRNQPHVARVYSSQQLEASSSSSDIIDVRVRNGYVSGESGDVIVIHDPLYVDSPRGTSHGSPWAYDTHVPLIFYGSPNLIKQGKYHAPVFIEDIAPTLSALLGVATTSGNTGRVLSEMFGQHR
jgi:predicted AlkP superfamily pyrophosphatase or phosphodiesterase